MAKPRNERNPTTSVIVVSTTVPAIAGSIPINLRKLSSNEPDKAAVNKLITNAAAMMSPRRTSLKIIDGAHGDFASG